MGAARRALARRTLRGGELADGRDRQTAIRQHEQGALRHWLRPRRGPTRRRTHTLTDSEILAAIVKWTELYHEPPATRTGLPHAPAAPVKNGGMSATTPATGPAPTPSSAASARSTAVTQAGIQPRPRGRHTASRTTIARDAREAIQSQLNTRGLQCGPAVVAARVRSVAAAREADDAALLRSALIDLAAAALSWADVVVAGGDRQPHRAA